MRDLLRKWFLPWTAEYLFSDDRQYQKWLQRRYASMRTARILCLLVAAVCLLVGYFLNRRPIMLLTTVPLLLVLGLTMAMEQMEAVMDGQDYT